MYLSEFCGPAAWWHSCLSVFFKSFLVILMYSPVSLLQPVSRINNIGTSGVTMRDDDPHLQQQLNFPHIPDDIWERGFNPANLRLDIDSLKSSTHGLSFKPLSDALYFGYEVGFLDQVDWS